MTEVTAWTFHPASDYDRRLLQGADRYECTRCGHQFFTLPGYAAPGPCDCQRS